MLLELGPLRRASRITAAVVSIFGRAADTPLKVIPVETVERLNVGVAGRFKAAVTVATAGINFTNDPLDEIPRRIPATQPSLVSEDQIIPLRSLFRLGERYAYTLTWGRNEMFRCGQICAHDHH